MVFSHGRFSAGFSVPQTVGFVSWQSHARRKQVINNDKKVFMYALTHPASE
jgi:hypothetical protein